LGINSDIIVLPKQIKEFTMPNNLQTYHKALQQLRQWLPQERITRLRNMALLILGLQLSGAIHLPWIVRKWPIAGKVPSLTNRLRRFLNNNHVAVRDWYHPLAQQLLAVFAGKEVRLIIDCTKVGFNHRLMTISIAYKKRTLPLVWSVHKGRKGHVGVAEQLKLFKYVRSLLPKGSQVWVMGDAGFESVPLLGWVRSQGWALVIRQNGRTMVCRPGQDWVKLNQLAIREGQTRTIGWVRLTRKHDVGWFFLVLHWEKGEKEPWFLISNRAETRQLIRRYRIRMWIEEMFGDMKGHGFDLEATHLADAERISPLVLAVCLTFVWFITLGSWVVKRGFRHLIDHKSRRDKSYFRLGWDWIERCLRLNHPVPIRFIPCF
jgi:hypothetical protein